MKSNGCQNSLMTHDQRAETVEMAGSATIDKRDLFLHTTPPPRVHLNAGDTSDRVGSTRIGESRGSGSRPYSSSQVMTEVSNSAHCPTTDWSRVIAAGDPTAPESRAALSDLCAAYWYPIYVLIRRRRNAPQETCDLAQDYFTRLLEKLVIAAAARSKGRFRAFLMTDCQNFLIDHHRRQRVRARLLKPISKDAYDAEARYRFEPADDATPDRLFDRAWATTLLDRVLGLLAQEYDQIGRADVFDRLNVDDEFRWLFKAIAS
jgi:DNA-directed RNA polymerase specialized sigma24 family protein